MKTARYNQQKQNIQSQLNYIVNEFEQKKNIKLIDEEQHISAYTSYENQTIKHIFKEELNTKLELNIRRPRKTKSINLYQLFRFKS